jgi:hypothetical protein
LNARIPFNPTHFEGLRRLISLVTSAAEIGVVGKKFDIIGSENNNNNNNFFKNVTVYRKQQIGNKTEN